MNRNNSSNNNRGSRSFRSGGKRGGVPLASVGRKILPTELVSEKLERRKPQPEMPQQQASGGKMPQQKQVSAQPRKTAQPEQNKNKPAKKQQPEKMPRAKTPVRIIPLGGLGEIGKNMTVIECANDMFIIDCGLAFPDAEMLGVDLVIPDFTYIEQNAGKLRGVVLTHGHEDHIGSLAYLLKKVNTPVYGTRLTLALVEAKLKEHQLNGAVTLNVVEPRKTIRMGCMGVELIRVNHSIPDAVALAIHTPAGVIVHTGDFKVDYSPINGEIIDLARFGELGSKGVLALLSESTNAERAGFTPTERKVGESFDKLFAAAEGKRIIIATFSSNIHRVQQIVNYAETYGRKVAVFGRSMVNVMTIARELGYLQVKEGTLIDIDLMNRYSDDQIVLITTGSQGEPMSALTRMAMGDHKKVSITPQDFIIISATPIPGNEKYVTRVVNELMRSGAHVVYERMYDVHVSGHACQEELKLMLALTKPQFFMPVHGEYKHLKKHSELAMEMGIARDHIVIGQIGDVIETNGLTMKVVGQAPAGRVLVDGLGVGDVGSVVLRDRQRLAEDGLIIVALGVDRSADAVVTGPELISRGFVYVKESEALMDAARDRLEDVIDNLTAAELHDWNALKGRLREALSDFIFRETKRSPMILPIILDV